ncbi:MAG: hypothetical protein K0S74_913 [Chlamydiales bacterium]|jgi:glycosyltransferase involved in cell wall biosynthesis|nr:hypothetical protein [Chlamydiales bacterium]
MSNNNIPIVSILCLINRPKKFFLDCIESILKQSYLCKQIIIIAGNCSREDQEFLKSYSPHILIDTTPYTEDEEGWKIGINHVKGEIFYLCPDYQILNSNIVSEVVQKLQENPDLGFVYGDYELKYGLDSSKLIKINPNLSFSDVLQGSVIPPLFTSFFRVAACNAISLTHICKDEGYSLFAKLLAQFPSGHIESTVAKIQGDILVSSNNSLEVINIKLQALKTICDFDSLELIEENQKVVLEMANNLFFLNILHKIQLIAYLPFSKVTFHTVLNLLSLYQSVSLQKFNLASSKLGVAIVGYVRNLMNAHYYNDALELLNLFRGAESSPISMFIFYFHSLILQKLGKEEEAKQIRQLEGQWMVQTLSQSKMVDLQPRKDL